MSKDSLEDSTCSYSAFFACSYCAFFTCSYSAFFVCSFENDGQYLQFKFWKWWTIFANQILKMMDNICSLNSENDWQYLPFKFWKWLTVFAVQILMDDSGRLVLFPLWTVHKMCVWLQRFGGWENVWLDLEVSVFNWVFCQCHRFWSSSWLVQCHRLWNSDDYAQ